LSVFEYYSDNKLNKLSFPNASVPTPAIALTYDPDYDRILTIQDGVGSTVESYYPITLPPVPGAGELASVSGPLPNSLVTYQYDNTLRMTNRAIAGVNFTTTYDALDRVVTASNPLGIFHYNYSDATERLTSLVYPNGQTNLYTYYDVLGEDLLKQIVNLKPNGSILSAFGYAYNSLGLITAWTNQWDTLPMRVWQFGYDAANQLTNAVRTDGISPLVTLKYGYDNDGNRVLTSSNGVQATATFNALNQLVSGGATPVSAGTYEWDAEKRLTAINQGTHRSEFTYDGQSHRVRIVEKDNGTVTSDNYLLWADAGVAEIRDSTGANVLRRLYSQGENVVNGAGVGNYYYTSDHLGSIREMSDVNGNVVARYDYDPYGQRNIISQSQASTFGFDGHYVHTSSGLNLTLFRAMDDANGRWLSRDPMGEFTGYNLYRFMGDDPVNMSDPLGLWFGWDDALAIGLGAAAGLAGQAVSDLIQGKSLNDLSWADYAAAAVGGAVGAEASLYLGPAVGATIGAGAAGGLAGNIVKQSIKVFVTHEQCSWSISATITDTVLGGAVPLAFNGLSAKNAVAGLSNWRGAGSAVSRSAKWLAEGAENSKAYLYIAKNNPAPNLQIGKFLAANKTPSGALQMVVGSAYDSGMLQTSVAGSLGGSSADYLREYGGNGPLPCPCH